MVNPLHKFILTILFSLLLLNASCAGRTSKETVGPELAINSIIVLPVTLTASFETETRDGTRIQETGTQVLTRLISEYFSGNNKVRIISSDQIEALDFNYNANRYSRTKAIGELMGSDAVMVLNMKHFVERDGSDYSVDQPASVAFDYLLLHTATGQTLCAGVFDETQKSWSDNILSLKIFDRGFRWLRAEDLLREGVADKLKNCRYLK